MNITYDHINKTVTIDGKTYKQSDITIAQAEALTRQHGEA